MIVQEKQIAFCSDLGGQERCRSKQYINYEIYKEKNFTETKLAQGASCKTWLLCWVTNYRYHCFCERIGDCTRLLVTVCDEGRACKRSL